MGLRDERPLTADGGAGPSPIATDVQADRHLPVMPVASGDGPISLAATLAIFALAFLVPVWPWLSGAVAIPWDGPSQFFPQLQFLASSIARGEWPWWTPNVFAGWPQISDPQSLLFSPLHVLLAVARPVVTLRDFDAVTLAYLFLGGVGVILFFRDRGWHMGGALVAAMAFALGGAASARLQHIGQVISLAYLPPTLWLLARALERSSWRSGLGAGVLAGLLVVGRDQVALISSYVLAGYVLHHWLIGSHISARIRASILPLLAMAAAATLVAAVPVIMSALLAARSNRPEVSFESAAGGSIHPVHLLQLAFADLFGAMDLNVEYWAPQSGFWDAAWGSPGLYLSQNMGLLYAGALTILVILAFGVVRGLAWASEIRFFTVAALVTLLYALGAYTPAFWLMYHLLPAVDLYRRPADATFVLVALLAIIAGYLVHRWLDGSVPAASRRQRVLELAAIATLVALAFVLAETVAGVRVVAVPVLTAVVFSAAAVAVLLLARRLVVSTPLMAVALIATFMSIDLAWNNAPHVSTALPADYFDALRHDTRDPTVQVLRERLAATTAPDRRDRVELIGIGYHWPNLSLAQGFDQVFGHNPLRLRWFKEATHVGDTVALASQRWFSPLYPSYHSAFADLLGVRFIATGVPVEEVDRSLRPGDLTLIARTPEAYVYENPRALPRVMLLTQWRVADFDALLRDGWPDVDPRQTVLLQRAPDAVTPSAVGGSARILRYANTEVTVEVHAPSGGILLLNDVWHPWWRAHVDGTEVEILAANVIFRAVVCPQGRHRIHFTFEPFAGALSELMAKVRR